MGEKPLKTSPDNLFLTNKTFSWRGRSPFFCDLWSPYMPQIFVQYKTVQENGMFLNCCNVKLQSYSTDALLVTITHVGVSGDKGRRSMYENEQRIG